MVRPFAEEVYLWERCDRHQKPRSTTTITHNINMVQRMELYPDVSSNFTGFYNHLRIDKENIRKPTTFYIKKNEKPPQRRSRIEAHQRAGGLLDLWGRLPSTWRNGGETIEMEIDGVYSEGMFKHSLAILNLAYLGSIIGIFDHICSVKTLRLRQYWSLLIEHSLLQESSEKTKKENNCIVAPFGNAPVLPGSHAISAISNNSVPGRTSQEEEADEFEAAMDFQRIEPMATYETRTC